LAAVIAVATLAISVFSFQLAPPAQCGLRMSLYGWRGCLVAPLGGQLAEVEVSRHGAWRLYVVLMYNGTYALAWDGKLSRSICID